MKRNKKAERERGREGGREGDLVLCLAKHEIMNVTLFFSVHVRAYMIG